MNKRDKNKRLKGFGIPVEVCVRYERMAGVDRMNEIKLKPCPFCGARVTMSAMTGAHAGGFSFCHHDGAHPNMVGGETFEKCVVRNALIFVNRREATEWAEAWNRRAGKGVA